ncbi:MAG: hypothetical protein J6P44_08345 [Bacteroidales bacterium]|nr:hypothetical protein [Bacteroidales bacterium]
MAVQKKKKETKQEKRRLIISYEKLPEKDKDAFEAKYEDGFMDFVQSVMRPDGTPMFVVPLETDENVYMVKVDLRVDTKMTDEEFDKEILHETKSEEDEITSLVNAENGKDSRDFRLNHGDYSSVNTIEEAIAKEDMDEDNFTSIDDIDVEDENSIMEM